MVAGDNLRADYTPIEGNDGPSKLVSIKETGESAGGDDNISGGDSYGVYPGASWKPAWRNFAWTGRGSATSQFSMSSSVAGCASSGCSAAVNGFFSGASAERAGIG